MLLALAAMSYGHVEVDLPPAESTFTFSSMCLKRKGLHLAVDHLSYCVEGQQLSFVGLYVGQGCKLAQGLNSVFFGFSHF